jgi:hypothetical protein
MLELLKKEMGVSHVFDVSNLTKRYHHGTRPNYAERGEHGTAQGQIGVITVPPLGQIDPDEHYRGVDRATAAR